MSYLVVALPLYWLPPWYIRRYLLPFCMNRPANKIEAPFPPLMASKEKGISSGQWHISVCTARPNYCQKVVISFSKDAHNGLPLREHIVNRSRHLTFGKQVRLTLYPEQFRFISLVSAAHALSVPEGYLCLSIPCRPTQCSCSFDTACSSVQRSLCVRFLSDLKELPFDMLQAGGSFNSRIGVTFQFSIRTVCVTLYCPLMIRKEGQKSTFPLQGTILVSTYQFLLGRDGHPDIPLPLPLLFFSSTRTLW